jgi:aryl-phospho-beta-D-glucosidase BglC (GH1 family)
MNRIGSRSPQHARCATGIAAFLLAFAAAACFTGGAVEAPAIVTVKLRGCTVTEGGAPHVAPGGYYTNGTSVCTAGGESHLFHGVDRPSLEWNAAGQNVTLTDFQAMAEWHANVVRIALDQDFWLTGAWLHNNVPIPPPGQTQQWSVQDAQSYQSTVAQAVHWAEAAGLDVILDLHWSDQGNLQVMAVGKSQDTAGNANQQQMADVNSKQFWIEVATKFKGDGHVLFELYNEPNDVSWTTWLNGGTDPGYQVVGMQELYDAVRSTGADNLVIAGGLSYAFDLSGVASFPIRGYNIMYATHPYGPQDGMASWDASFGYLAAGDIAPVIVTEFGDMSAMCTGAFDMSLIQYADMYKISWTAWAWYPGGCGFPSLITDFGYTPTPQGSTVRTALLGYLWAPPDAGADGAATDATLDDGPGDAPRDDAPSEASVEGASSDALPLEDAAGDASDGGDATDDGPGNG